MNELRKAYSWVAWAYLLLSISINIGRLEIVPDWLCYLVMFAALPVISAEEGEARKLRPFAALLAAWSGLIWVLSIFGFSPHLVFIPTIFNVAGLYFHFQLLTHLAAAASNHGADATPLLRLRTARTLLAALVALPLPWADMTVVLVILALAQIFIGILLWYRLRQILPDSEPGQ